jgi:hypothetical protein
MTGFTPKIPTDYSSPYKHMLHDFEKDMKSYKAKIGIMPNYIVINSDDINLLIEEMQSFNLLQKGKPVGKLQFQGVRIITSPDIMKGFFEVLGN